MIHPLQHFSYTIGILGATGNIGSSIVRSLLEQGLPPECLLIANSKGGTFQFQNQIIPLSNLKKVCQNADILVLGIKPQIWKTLDLPYKDGQIIVSPMAGITVETINKRAFNSKVTRFMPNTACRINQGLIGVWKADLTDTEFETIKCLYSNGLVMEFKQEEDLNKITVAASGIAFYFYMMELLEKIGLENGITAADAKTAILEGCAEMYQTLFPDTRTLSTEVNTILKQEASIDKTLALKILLQNAFYTVYLKALELADEKREFIQEQKARIFENPLFKGNGLAKTDVVSGCNVATKVDLQPHHLKSLAYGTTHLFINALEDFFISQQFSLKQANTIAMQTFKGAYGLMTEPNARTAAVLRSNVTSKRGTTQAGLAALGLSFNDDIAQPSLYIQHVCSIKGYNYPSLYSILKAFPVS